MSWCREYAVDELTAEHETKMFETYSTAMITDFPESTSPFWNMSRYPESEFSKKIDVILGGMETIGSAERSTDVDQMRDTFHTITMELTLSCCLTYLVRTELKQSWKSF